MNFASTYELAAAQDRRTELHRQAAEASLARLAKRTRSRRKAA